MGDKIIKTLYLDVCLLCRPFDDQQAMRIRLETDCYHLIMQAIHEKQYRLMRSPVHDVEIGAISTMLERIELQVLLTRYGTACQGNGIPLRQRAAWLHEQGMGLGDAAHVAYAEVCSDLLLTCDDRLIKLCRRLSVSIPVMSPIEFCLEEDLR